MSNSQKSSTTRGGLGAKLNFGIRTSKSAEMAKSTPLVLHEVGRLVAGVSAVATGSATGNPRNKCALQPGHSLMDWIRLGASGRDLTGVGPLAGTVTVSPRQLAEHTSPNDAWIAIRGRVYNVTHYLPFHPGGPEELMRGVGRDATKLFDQVHAWVNYEQILQKCLVGRLMNADPETEAAADVFRASINPSKTSSSAPTSPTRAVLPPLDPFLQPTPVQRANTPPTLPKFDWIQKTDSVTFIFYTKPYSNCEIRICKLCDNQIRVNLIYDSRIFINTLKIKSGIRWPCRTSLNYETGKCEVVLRKCESTIWSSYGSLNQSYEEVSVLVCDSKDKCSVVDRIKITHNTYLILLKRTMDTVNVIPVGQHVRVYMNIKGQQYSRSYTPVPSALAKKFEPTSFSADCTCLMVKQYAQGLVSSAICNVPIGGTIEISPPTGGFRIGELENIDTYLLVAAGTGITPMFSILLFVLSRRNRRCQKVKLLFFNRSEKDILWRDQLDAIAKDDNRFNVDQILSEPNDKWIGKGGKVDRRILQASLEDLISSSGSSNEIARSLATTYVCICGPSPFTQLTESLLKEISIENSSLAPNQIHCFLG